MMVCGREHDAGCRLSLVQWLCCLPSGADFPDVLWECLDTPDFNSSLGISDLAFFRQ